MNKIFHKNIEYIFEIEKINNKVNNSELFDLLNNLKEHLQFERNSNIIQTFLFKFITIYFKIDDNLKTIFLLFFKRINFVINLFYSFENLESYLIQIFWKNENNIIHTCKLLINLKLYKIKNLTNFNIYLYTYFLNIKNLKERKIIRKYLNKWLNNINFKNILLNTLDKDFYLNENQFLNILYLLENLEFNNMIIDIVLFKKIMKYIEHYNNVFNNNLLNIIKNYFKNYTFDIDIYYYFIFSNKDKFKEKKIKKVLFILFNKTNKKYNLIEEFIKKYINYFYNFEYDAYLKIDLNILSQINLNKINKKALFKNLKKNDEFNYNKLYVIYINMVINNFYNYYRNNVEQETIEKIIENINIIEKKENHIKILLFTLNKLINKNIFNFDHNIIKINYCIDYLDTFQKINKFNDLDKDIIACHLIFKKIINKEKPDLLIKKLLKKMKLILKILIFFDKLYYQYFINFYNLILFYNDKFILKKNIKKFKIKYNKYIIFSFDLYNLNKNLQISDIENYVNSDYYLKIRKSFINKNLYLNELNFKIYVPKTINFTTFKKNIITVFYKMNKKYKFVNINIKNRIKTKKNIIELNDINIKINKESNDDLFYLNYELDKEILENIFNLKINNYLKLQFNIYIKGYFFKSISKDIKLKI